MEIDGGDLPPSREARTLQDDNKITFLSLLGETVPLKSIE
jgi:hypothetical protein